MHVIFSAKVTTMRIKEFDDSDAIAAPSLPAIGILFNQSP